MLPACLSPFQLSFWDGITNQISDTGEQNLWAGLLCAPSSLSFCLVSGARGPVSGVSPRRERTCGILLFPLSQPRM